MALLPENESVVAWYSEANRAKFLATAGVLVFAVAALDWRVQANLGLGFLYILPILLAAVFLKRWQILLLVLACAALRESFGPFPKGIESIPRTANVMVGFLAAGLFVREMAQNRRLAARHLRQIESQVKLRQDAEEQLRVLIESSPAAIFAVDTDGRILLANEAAHRLLGFERQPLRGEKIGSYLPVLAAVQGGDETIEFFRTAIESKGRRRGGEIFPAQIWLSTYRTSSGPRLAAIVLDASEEMRDREEAGLHQLLASSRVLVGAVSHEIRNLTGAISVVHANLARVPHLDHNDDFRALGSLVEGLQKIAAAELRAPAERILGGVELQSVLDDLRIVVEPSFEEREARLLWEIPALLPRVRGNHHGLLQVFLNLAQNSLRAMEQSDQKLLSVRVSAEDSGVVVRFCDTGPGVARPEVLFQPFQQGADVAGLGLYVSQAIVRSFAGELRCEAQAQGACFAVDLLPAGSRQKAPS